MRTMTNRASPIFLPPTLFTIPEAAWVADTEVQVVEGEFDKKVVTTRAEGKRLLDRCDVSYLRAVREFHKSLDVHLRRHILEQVRDALQKGNNRRIPFDAFVLRLAPILVEIDRRIRNVRDTRDLVEVNANIRGGEPIIKGTRIPARALAEMMRDGASCGELASEYDLTPRQVELAILFDQLHPRRGRPLMAANDRWSDIGGVRRVDVEELGEYHKS